MMSTRSIASCLITASIALALTTSAAAESPRAPGSNTGDGSTPFTGLAQAPDANLNVGASRTSVAIQVPPGRKALTPKLAVAYSSSGGPSPYGYGWDLPLGKIQRNTKHGVPRCGASPYQNDFVLLLPEANVECTLDGNNRCNAVVEESFLRIEYRPAPDDKWEVWDKTGLHYVFGDVQTARAPVYPDPSCSTFAWALTHIDDLNGNAVDLTYITDAPPGIGLTGVSYPNTIRYGGTTPANHKFEVSFVWTDRPAGDQIVNSIGGFPARLTKLLAKIEVRYLVPTSALVRWYKFEYEFQTSAPDRAARQAFLSAVTLFDRNNNALSNADGGAVQTTFLYHQNDPTAQTNNRFGFGSTAQNATWPAVAQPTGMGRYTEVNSQLATTYRDILDMNGDGIPDLVDTQTCAGGGWKVYFGTPQGFSTTPVTWSVPTAAGVECALRKVSLWNSPWSFTVYDTFDVNGDGVVDWITGPAWGVWNVFLGHRGTNGTTGWGFDSRSKSNFWETTDPDYWPFPLGSYLYGGVRVSEGGVDVQDPVTLQWYSGAIDHQDFIDINGDGLPDIVRDDGATGWRVWFNTGNGFDEGAGTPFWSPSPFLRFNADSGSQLIGVYDINGDGLPDQILAFTNSWQVYLNGGHALGTTPEAWVGPASGCGYAGLRHSLYSNHSDVTRDFIDINGDGLPDLVDACGWSTSNKWQVYLNRGGGFSQVYSWWSPTGLIRDVDDHEENTGGKTYQDTFDIDGDGMVDFVDFRSAPYKIYHAADGAWAVNGSGNGVVENTVSARTDVLEQMENGLGGTTYLDYRPSTQWNNTDTNGIPRLPFPMWTVTRIEQDDGLCNDAGTTCVTQGGHTVSTDIRYYYGWFEPLAKEFRGFGTVEQYDAAGDRRTTWFHQDGARKGKTYSSANTTPTGSLLVSTYDLWVCVDPATQAALDCPQVLAAGQRRWVRLTDARRFDVNPDATSKLAYTRNLGWDSYGNVTQTQKGGDGTTSVITNAEYAYRNDSSAYIVDKPKHLWVTSGGNTLEEKWFAYDLLGLGQLTKGNVTTVYSWLDQVLDTRLPAGDPCPQGSGKCITTQMAYDSYGNVTSVVDGNGNLTTTTYDTATNIYPYQAKNAANHEVATAYDPACGTMLWQTVAYAAGQTPTAQKRTEYTYDTFCRLTTTSGPYPGAASNVVTRTYDYYIGTPWQGSVAATPTELVVSELVAGDPTVPSSFIWAARSGFFDALGRPLQMQRDAVVDGNYTIVSEDTVQYDTRGNVTKRYAPFTSFAIFTPNPPGATGFTTYVYDALSRVTQVTNPDGTWRTMDHTIAWQTTTKDECYNAGSCPGGKVIERRDAFGRTIEKQLYKGDTFETRTGYTYDGLGRLTLTKQGTTLTTWQTSNPDTQVKMTFDSLGRKIKTEDPDTGPPTGPAGVWVYGYDRAGNLIFQNDPKTGQRVEYCYDTINRVTATYYHSDTAPNLVNCATEPKDYTKDIVYRYDEGGGYHLGRLTSVIDPSNPVGNPPSAATVLTYDVRGRTTSVQKTISVNGTARTAVTAYTYDVADHPKTIQYPAAQGESTGEVVTYTYDVAGQTKTMIGAATYLSNLKYDLFGRPSAIVHGNGTTDTRTYWDKTKNYRLASIVTTQGGTTHLNLSYASYTATGQLTQLNDLRHTSGVLSNTATYTYDGLSRLTQASGVNLPAPNTYAYDALGNMTLKEGTTLTPSTTKPHQLTAVGATHDDNGNRAAKTNQTYTYNGDDRLTQVTVSGVGSVGFGYDYSGRQVARVAGSSIIRYFSELAESSSDGYLTKHYFAAGLRIASRRAYAPLLAGLPPDPAIQVAQGSPGQAALVLVLRADVQRGVLLSVIVLGTGLLVAPWRRKRVVGIALRHGHVIGVIIVLSIATLPMPLIVKPAAAQTPPTLYHWHVDHLGSAQVITDSGGAVNEYIRYKPYGTIRGRYNSSGGSVTGPQYRYEFTGYETETTSLLQYAGARFYDPALGSFLTHDPVRQFASPYTYTNWNPTNLTDPNGEIAPIFILLIGFAAGFAAASIQAAVNGASFGQALQAGAQGGLLGVYAGFGLGIVGPALAGAVAGEAGVLAYNLALTGLGAYTTVESFRSEQYVIGAVALVATAFGAYGSYKSGRALYSRWTASSSTGAPAPSAEPMTVGGGTSAKSFLDQAEAKGLRLSPEQIEGLREGRLKILDVLRQLEPPRNPIIQGHTPSGRPFTTDFANAMAERGFTPEFADATIDNPLSLRFYQVDTGNLVFRDPSITQFGGTGLNIVVSPSGNLVTGFPSQSLNIDRLIYIP